MSQEELRNSFRGTALSGVDKAITDTLSNEEERLSIVLWILLGWMEWIGFLGMEGKAEAIFDLAVEAQVDLEASVYLALSGFVKQALQCLRSWLELSLLGVWFGYDNTGYRKWSLRMRESPFFTHGFFKERNLKAMFNKSALLKRSEERYQMSNMCVKLYRTLSSFTHTRGITSFETWGRRKPIATYNPKNFRRWYYALWSSYSLVSTILFFRFPNAYLLHKTKFEKWEAMVTGMKGRNLAMVEELLSYKKPA